MPVDIRILTEPDELEQVVDLEIAVWGVAPRDVVPMNLMRPIVQHGGVALGAFLDNRLVGMTLALPLRHAGRWVLWSHNAGVHPDYQSQGIGFALKLAQRDWALDNGYAEIRWTFDPLQPGNANFNLHRLGATADTYHVAYYGFMDDAINQGAQADRIEASWKLKSARVKALAVGKPPKQDFTVLETAARILEIDSNGEPLALEPPSVAQRLLVALPRLSGVSGPLADKWRAALRSALQTAFARGYVAVDFIEADGQNWYLLEAPATWYLYVLRCADNSLYTGVTPDLQARLQRHQSGKGAAYTATRRPVEMIGAWAFAGRSQALKAEIAFKSQTRATKLSRVLKKEPFQGAPFVDDFADG